MTFNPFVAGALIDPKVVSQRLASGLSVDLENNWDARLTSDFRGVPKTLTHTVMQEEFDISSMVRDHIPDFVAELVWKLWEVWKCCLSFERSGTKSNIKDGKTA